MMQMLQLILESLNTLLLIEVLAQGGQAAMIFVAPVEPGQVLIADRQAGRNAGKGLVSSSGPAPAGGFNVARGSMGPAGPWDCPSLNHVSLSCHVVCTSSNKRDNPNHPR